MKTRALVALVTMVAGTASADISVLENRKRLDVDCAKHARVELIGNHNRVVLKGTCAKVTVTGNHCTVVGSTAVAYISGNHNTLELDSADDMTLAGNRNTLTYRRGVAARPPKVKNLGKDNKVSRVK